MITYSDGTTETIIEEPVMSEEIETDTLTDTSTSDVDSYVATVATTEEQVSTETLQGDPILVDTEVVDEVIDGEGHDHQYQGEGKGHDKHHDEGDILRTTTETFETKTTVTTTTTLVTTYTYPDGTTEVETGEPVLSSETSTETTTEISTEIIPETEGDHVQEIGDDYFAAMADAESESDFVLDSESATIPDTEANNEITTTSTDTSTDSEDSGSTNTEEEQTSTTASGSDSSPSTAARDGSILSARTLGVYD